MGHMGVRTYAGRLRGAVGTVELFEVTRIELERMVQEHSRPRVDETSGSGLTVSGFVCAWRFVWEARPRESGAADVVVEELRR